ncbi:hypothetical protein CASFOL_012976 [Castilleja foliolosa]|uniref:F-box domain-containing protein n=1 Tax=Castilleja foliolosa TaxID=1961234 RepID=A0ABD3DMQ7_9LAMI
MDRISQLPIHILHRILSNLSQKQSIRTCILSKSWRHVGSTRPKIEFLEEFFNGDKQSFLSVIDSTLQRYLDQNLSVHQFIICMWALDPQSISLLEKWIPILVRIMRVKTFHLCFNSERSDYFDLPSIVFQSQTLENLHLERCLLREKSIDSVRLNNLQTVRLDRVRIKEETFEKILSSCPLIEKVSLFGCNGLKTICVFKPRNLKHFAFGDYYELNKEQDPSLSIKIDSPSVRTIQIAGCSNWNQQFNYFPNLESLFLNRVKLSSDSFEFFSSKYLPCLECFTIDSCYGFEICYLNLSGSVKYLTIRNLEKKPIDAVIEAPNIVEFVYEGEIPELSLSFKADSPDWKSNIILCSYSDFDNNASSWFNKLICLLRSLSESKITLKLVHHRRTNRPIIQAVPSSLLLSDVDYRCFYQPVEVVHLSLSGYFSSSSFPAFLNCLFCVCHPKYVSQHSYSYATTDWEREDKELNESLLQILVMETEMRRYFWPRDLEDICWVEALDKIGQKQNVVWIQLKWRE